MQHLVSELKKLCYLSGQIALTYRDNGLTIECKDDHSLVTNADKEIDRTICARLKQLTPELLVVSEEGELNDLNLNKPSDYWLVDPIDGTNSYIRGEDNYTVNIALIRKHVPVLGFIYHPTYDTLYYTNNDSKLFIEHNSTEKYQKLVNCESNDYIGVCGPNLNNLAKDYIQSYFGLKQIISITSSFKLALIAEGKADIWFCRDAKKEWDIAAGHALVNASGGKVISLDGSNILYGEHTYFINGFIALSKKYYDNNKENILKNHLENKLLSNFI